MGKVGRPNELTQRQKEFAKYYVEGLYSNAECARKAGYAEESARQQAHKFLNGTDFPLVVEYIKDLREARERRYGITLIGQLKRLEELSVSAEEAGQFSAAINAEKIRSALGGLTIDRREQKHIHEIDQLSREEVAMRLANIRKDYPHAFGDVIDAKVIDDREETLAITEEKSAEEDILPTD